MWVLQHYSVHAFDMSTIIVFLCIWGCKSNEISLAQTTLTIPVVYIRGRMLGSDLTYWPPNQILSVHWDTTGQTKLEDDWSHKFTGMPLEPHWLMLVPSGVPVAIQCWSAHLEHPGRPLQPQVHWNATGTTLADASTQWCSSVNLHNWNTLQDHWKSIGRPLEDYWEHTGYQQFFIQWHSSVQWGLSSRHTGLPLDCHWKTTGSG